MGITKSEIQLVRSLADKKGRNETGLFVAEGDKLVGEMTGSHLRVRRIFCVAKDTAPYSCLTDFRGEITIVSPAEMERLSLLKTPTPVLALVEIPRYGHRPEIPADELTLALDDIQDPGNMGTIVRLADWFGIRDIFCSEATADCFNPKVVQATMGAIARVRVHYGRLEGWLTESAAKDIPAFGTFLDGENIYRAELPPAGVIVMGNEGKGISADTGRLVGRRLFIPPYPAGEPGSESLNVGVATAIVCSEFRRRVDRA